MPVGSAQRTVLTGGEFGPAIFRNCCNSGLRVPPSPRLKRPRNYYKRNDPR